MLLFDVDGVFTDGKLFIFPAPAGIEETTQAHPTKHVKDAGFGLIGDSVLEAKGFHAHEGLQFHWQG